MLIGDLIKELQKFPELSTVFIQVDHPNTGQINRLDSTHEIWVTLPVASDGLAGPYTQIPEGETPDADAVVYYGVLLYG